MRRKQCLGLFIALILACPAVISWGIVTDVVGPEVPLSIKPGQTKDVRIYLQNMGSDEELTVQAIIEDGSEIAWIVDDDLRFTVPGKSSMNEITLRVAMPENAEIGSTHFINISFQQISASDSGQMVQFTTAIGTYIPVKVTTDAPEQAPATPPPVTQGNAGSPMTFFIIIVLVVIIIALFLMLLKHKKHDEPPVPPPAAAASAPEKPRPKK